ncbi:MAG TPA: 3-isopropylmalate dehydrogenase [Deltaproteobacteria bacterium]|nr:MAG: 3-isopropylmalate dehydrogenase [Deltaproteobacteria bacterium GWC2_65_14]HBO69595.1 3-isopropylmalate dehydrogenase [Deltaproteobacteria bacterium]
MKKICVFPGDGIGPEVAREALSVLRTVEELHGRKLFECEEELLGGASYDAHGVPMTERALRLAASSDAVLLGAVGGPKWDSLPFEVRPERALLGLRKQLGLFANLRPAKVYGPLLDASPLRRELVEGIDLLVVRELTGGIYFGEPRGVRMIDGVETGINTLVYTRPEIERVARVAFELARKRKRQVTSVDKSNVLEATELWRRVVSEVHEREFRDVGLSHMLVDNCAMQLIRRPGQFDVIVTTNLFGDILTDEASMITGSIGMLPSASLGGAVGLYEPIHGSAPDIAGKGVANPLAAILSVAMMLEYTLAMSGEAGRIERAVERVLAEGYRTADIYREGPGIRRVGTEEIGEQVRRILRTSG